MLPRTTRPQTLGTAVARSTTLVRPSRPSPQSKILGPVALTPVTDVAALAPPAAAPRPAVAPVADGPCLRQDDQVVCAEQVTCVCPLSARVTDRERAVMNDIARQTARLRAVLGWAAFAVLLVALVLLTLP